MQNKTVLIIEDNEMNMKLFKALLQVNGNRVIGAEDAESGFKLLEDQKPDLILMDIQLPGMDGYAAAEKIKHDPRLQDIPVVALTAYAMQGDEEKAISSGCDGYISKPIDTRSFLGKLNRFLEEGDSQTKKAELKLLPYKKRILVVDDEPKNLKLIEAILPSDTYDIITAKDGEEAIYKTFAEFPDVILLDVMMPGKDGFQVTRELKNDPDSRNIPIILVTALDGLDSKLTGLDAGAEEYLTKPVKPVELLARISSMLQLKQYRDQLALRSQSEAAFPDEDRDRAPAAATAEEIPNVLLVEDNEIDARIVKRLLENHPLRLEVVKSGAEALSRLKSKKIDLVLLDILLPDINGFEICQRIKELDINHDTPIIVITCLDDLDSRITGIKLGSDDFLVKPINGQELLARIKVLLEKKDQLDKLRAHYETALNSAINDWLTGLYNQGYFKKFLGLEIKRSQRQKYPINLLMIDIDDFKKWNDSLGHAEGDRILQTAAGIIRKVTREVDLTARYGGDEFAVVLPYSDRDGALRVADRVQKAIQDHEFFTDKQEKGARITCSIGIAMYPADAVAMEGLIRKADKMLYQAKKHGKNQVCQYPLSMPIEGDALASS